MIAKSGDAEIWYDVLGSRRPSILAIEGIGYSSWMWTKQVQDLPRTRQFVIFDNRGVGRSSSPQGPYSMKQLADDVQAVADAARLERFYILGVSMGGMVAQEYYFSHPERVAGLILSNTNYGKGSTLPGQEVLRILSSTASSAFNFEGLGERMRPAVSKRFIAERREEFDEVVRTRLAIGDDAKGYLGQLYAVAGFDSHGRLPGIRVPTLLTTAEEDLVVPPENSYEMHRRVPASRLVVLRDAGHLSLIERSDAFDRQLLRFIDEVESGTFQRAESPELV